MGLPLHVVVLLTWVGAMLEPVALPPAGGGAPEALRPVQTIELPNVEGRIDHFALDAKGNRLFVAALGNNTIEVIDLAAGRWVRSISPISNPQGVAFVPDGGGRLAAADGGDGICRIYDGKTFNPVAEIPGLGDADNIRYDAATHRLYVGYGKNGRDGLAVIDPAKGKKSAPDIPLDGHPESFRLEEKGQRIFVNVPIARPKRGVKSGPNNGAHVAVVDRQAGKVVATWPVPDRGANFPMWLDEPDRRLFVACRAPAAVMLVFAIDSGKVVATLPCVDDADDLFYDPATKRGYIIGGAGFITVFDRREGDHYEAAGNFKSAGGARTGLFVPETGRLYVAMPHRGQQKAEVRVYTATPAPAAVR
jgi:DNA-binding beta-propeller fold protein YncE